MPAVEKTTKLPRSAKWPFLALDADGFDLPSDWSATYADYCPLIHY
jgi:hypothetical protein